MAIDRHSAIFYMRREQTLRGSIDSQRNDGKGSHPGITGRSKPLLVRAAPAGHRAYRGTILEVAADADSIALHARDVGNGQLPSAGSILPEANN
jgi:hypothetical protein